MKKLFFPAGLRADPLPDPGLCKACHGAHFARHSLLLRLEFAAGIKADLFHLLRTPFLVKAVLQRCFDRQSAAGQLHPCESRAAVPGDLEDPGSELIAVDRRPDQRIQAPQELADALLPQSRAEYDRKELPAGRQFTDLINSDLFALQVTVHEVIVADRDLLLDLWGIDARHEVSGMRRAAAHHAGSRHDIHAPRAQFFLDGRHQSLSVGSVLVHLVDKEEYRHIIVVQQAPQNAHLPVHAVRRADHQDRAVQDPQHALHLRGEIHVTRRVLQSIGSPHATDLRGIVFGSKPRLFGENSDPSLFFHIVRIQECVAMVYAARISDRSGDVQERFRKCRFARVHMGQDSQDQVLLYHIYYPISI